MKNTMKVLGIIAIVALIGFSMAACGSDGNNSGGSGTTKFEGKWVNLSAINNFGYSDFSFTFTGNNMLFKSVDNQGRTDSWPGTFTFTNTEITFIPEQVNTWPGWKTGYTLNGYILELAEGGPAFGTFTKQ